MWIFRQNKASLLCISRCNRMNISRIYCLSNTLRPRRDGRHFPDDLFICIFLNENEWHSIKISLKFVPKLPINNIPTLVQIMAWCQPGDKPLSEPMMVVLPTHICVTRPQWINSFMPEQQRQLSVWDNILRCIFDKEMIMFWFEFHWSVFLWMGLVWVQLIITQHGSGQWLPW